MASFIDMLMSKLGAYRPPEDEDEKRTYLDYIEMQGLRLVDSLQEYSMERLSQKELREQDPESQDLRVILFRKYEQLQQFYKDIEPLMDPISQISLKDLKYIWRMTYAMDYTPENNHIVAVTFTANIPGEDTFTNPKGFISNHAFLVYAKKPKEFWIERQLNTRGKEEEIVRVKLGPFILGKDKVNDVLAEYDAI